MSYDSNESKMEEPDLNDSIQNSTIINIRHLSSVFNVPKLHQKTVEIFVSLSNSYYSHLILRINLTVEILQNQDSPHSLLH